MDNKLPADTLEAIEMKAEHEAALHFHPIHSRDQNTACRICYRNGAKEYAIKLHQVEQENLRLKASEVSMRWRDKAMVALLEKFISRHEGGLLPDTFIYKEIKTFLDGK